jgi:pyridoxamine 5'-phosphate oxidase
MTDFLKNVRRDFTKGALLENELPEDPLDLLLNWYQAAVDSKEQDANAMSLSTLDLDGYPVSRVVLLRYATKDGLSFFTNYKSAKGLEIEKNPKGAVQFLWKSLERQVRVRGRIERLPAAESDAYFASRPRESQIGAWASPQSEVIVSRETIENSVAAYTAKFASEATVPRPPHWGGYRILPVTFEFWQGRPSRLHDRMRASRVNDGWKWERLAP